MTRTAPRRVRRRHSVSSRSLLFGGMLLAALTVVLGVARELNRPLLRAFTWLTPLRTLVLVGVVAVVAALVPPVGHGVRRAGAAFASLSATWSLSLLVALGMAVQVVRGARKEGPFVLGDELVYSDLAKSVARSGELLLFGSPHLGHSVLYPVAISPFFALASDTATALDALQLVQALWMALAAVPAYLLARAVVSHGWSLAVAALTALVPWAGYAALVMTESLFFPCFLVFALVLVRALERPTVARQAAVLALLLALALIRPQAVALAPAVATAVLLHARARLRPHAPLLVAVTTVALGAAFVLAAGRGGPGAAYGALFDDVPGPLTLGLWAVRNVAGIALALGVVPLAAFPLALARLLRHEASAAEHAVGATSIACFCWVTASVALLSASPWGFSWVHERSLFFVTPLVLACVAHWVAAGAPASRRALLLCCTATLLALASLTAPLIRRSSDLDAPAIVPLERMLASHPSVPAQAWIIGAGLIACAVLVLARRTPAPLFAAAFGTLIAAGSLVWADDLTPSELRRFGWVDGALPPGATATLLHVDLPVDRRAPCAEAAEYEQQGLALWTEFLNDRIDRVYHLYGDLGRAAVASPELRLAKRQGILLTRDGRSIGPDYVVVDSRETLAGTRLRRFEPGSAGVPYGEEGSSLTLWRSEKPLRVGPRHFPAPPRADGRSCQASSTRNRSSNSSSKPSPRRRGRDIALARVTTVGVPRAMASAARKATSAR